MRAGWQALGFVALLMGPTGCDQDRLSTDDPIWTLYREPSGAPRAYVATFDAELVDRANKDSCEVARRAFEGQRELGVRYGCEIGRFRKPPRKPG